jgi:aminoglycoside phosphotransferase (APT) family kinase protein
MGRSEPLPPFGALDAVKRLAGSHAAILNVARLGGGQHADTWKVDLDAPPFHVVVRQFPAGDSAAGDEQRVLRALDGLGGLAPLPLGCDLEGQWSERPTSLVSWLDGTPDITPSDPAAWAGELGRALARVHGVPAERLPGFPSVFEREGAEARVSGPLAPQVRARWSQIARSPYVLTHDDYWSGNVVWRDGKVTGIVDWSGGARGPRGFDLGWCRLDLVLLLGEPAADIFLAAYEAASGRTQGEMRLWDSWAVARSHDIVETWTPNYAPFGRSDLTPSELRRRHSLWAARVAEAER